MYIDYKDILAATDGGLDIILSYYPQAQESLQHRNKAFKIREEKTASASIKKLPDGNYCVTDFGGDQTPRNAIQICMQEENISFREAIILLGGRFNIKGISEEINKPEFKKRAVKKGEKVGDYIFDFKKELTEKELKTLGEKVTKEVCAKFDVKSCNSVTYITKDKKGEEYAFITNTTDDYPVFVFEHDNFNKVYEPLNPKKNYRFKYTGNRDKDYINGLKQIRDAHAELNEGDTEGKEKLDMVILASGERDALNVAGFGYFVVWLNSETAILTEKQHKELRRYVDEIYVLPDIDDTGKNAAIRLALKYMEIKIIWLPEKLMKYKDRRRNPRKDFCDYVEIFPKIEDFKKLIRVAAPLRFWDQHTDKSGVKYFFNNEQAYNFLWANGFFRIENLNSKDGYSFIHVKDNIVREIRPYEPKQYVLNYCKDNYLSIGIRNLIHKTQQLSDKALAGLPMRSIDFTDFDEKTQFFFFKNKIWKADAKEVKEFRPAEIQKYVWQEEVIPHHVNRLDDAFTITYDAESEEYDIEVKDTRSPFFRFLINSSRMYWKKEYEENIHEAGDPQKYRLENKFNIAGPLLPDEEIWEQKQHLINKIFAIGYLLHRHKDPSRPWCVFAMDNKISETGESHGRSGKSFCFKSLRFFMKSVNLNGRNQRLTENPHIYERVNEYTDFILIDDADQYLKFSFFFDALTSDMTINQKNIQSYEIPFEKSPKFCITSNYTLQNIDPSTEGRILYTVFSDYYHVQTDNDDYKETHTINDDFGKNLFMKDYTPDEWNFDFNFFAECARFYLSVPSPRKINPPLSNVRLRNLRTQMGEVFMDWAVTYFNDESGNLNKNIIRSSVLNEFMEKTKMRKWTTNRFTKALKAFCKYYKFVYNPKELRNSQGRISQKIDGKTEDMVHIACKNAPIPPETLAENMDNLGQEVSEEDKPF